MQILHRPLSADTYPHSAPERCPDLVRQFLEIFPGTEAGKVDFEDWAENTLMLLAMRNAAGTHGYPFEMLARQGACHVSGHNPITPRAIPGGEKAVMWGVFTSADGLNGLPEGHSLVLNDRDSCKAITRWPLTQTFRELAGRHVEILDMDIEGVRGALAAMRRSGHLLAFLKTTEKGWSTIVDTAEDIPSDIAWDIVANEGSKSALILQGTIEPRCEYRLFVVAGKVVTGAGCIEAFTPLDRVTDEPFDVRVEIQRNKTRYYEDPALVRRYVAFAEAFAERWSAEVSAGSCYTLDLCLDARTREVVPIELNPLANTGLYASCPRRLADALVSAAH